MKTICLCIKIHVPVVLRTFRFSDINQNDNYYNDLGSDYHFNKIYTENLHPFFKTVRNIFSESEGAFKVAVSISGITLKLLQNFVPQAIDMLSELAQDGCIEFLSEPWSHSIASFSNSETLLSQIGKHDEMIFSIFGKVPEVLIIHSPICPEQVWRTVQQKEGKGVFIYSNHLEKTRPKPFSTSIIPSYPNEGIHPVHRTLSQILQKLDFDPDAQSLDNFTSGVLRKMKNYGNSAELLVLVYNPSVLTGPFNINTAFIWKATINKLLADERFQFCLPSETKNSINRILSGMNILNKEKVHFSLPVDAWLKNELQKKAYTEQLTLQTRMQACNNKSLHYDWDFIQDMDHLFYMNSNFFVEDYREDNYSPYTSPYFAFTNYMNVLEDLSGKLENLKSIGDI